MAAQGLGVTASLLDQASSLADRATSYPLAVKVVFVSAFVAVLASVFVYALLFPAEKPGRDPAARDESRQ